MFEKIHNLKCMGYTPDAILDIGAHHGNWTFAMRHIYPSANYYLYEGIDYPELGRYNDDAAIKVYNVLLNDTATTVDWYQMKNTGDSFFREKTHHFTNCEPIKRDTTTLSTQIAKENILQDAKNIMMKIDCQGAEIPILKGTGRDVLDRTDFIILEIPLFGQYNEGVPTFLEHIAFMESIGFATYDIIDNHYINGFNMQVDVLFINKNHPFNKIVNERLL